ncbi:hypothetical protein [Endozoicomonas sp. Mp262]|uniref:hypothetical protein n=1 Tax=Endozoicomonas sp. Mp262 TaxID=2919499 RepID=UPI0021D9FA2D
MNFCGKRTAIIESLKDGHIVANLSIDYQVDEQDNENTVKVDLQVSGEQGLHHTHFSLRRDVYYNLPQKINEYLREHRLVGNHLTAPFCQKSGAMHAPLAMEIVTELNNILGVPDSIDLDRFLSDGY